MLSGPSGVNKLTSSVLNSPILPTFQSQWAEVGAGVCRQQAEKREKDKVPHGSGYSRGNEAQIPRHYFIRDFNKVKSLGMRESVRRHKVQEASSDFIVNHRLRLFGGIAASFQVQIIIRILLWRLRKKHRSARTTCIQPMPGHIPL